MLPRKSLKSKVKADIAKDYLWGKYLLGAFGVRLINSVLQSIVFWVLMLFSLSLMEIFLPSLSGWDRFLAGLCVFMFIGTITIFISYIPATLLSSGMKRWTLKLSKKASNAHWTEDVFFWRHLSFKEAAKFIWVYISSFAFIELIMTYSLSSLLGSFLYMNITPEAAARVWGLNSIFAVLFLIAAIVLYFRNMFVPYILAERPRISGREVRLMSKTMTSGHKWELFVLHLSMIGWGILSSAFPPALLYTVPYFHFLRAAAFFWCKDNAYPPAAPPISSVDYGTDAVIAETIYDFDLDAQEDEISAGELPAEDDGMFEGNDGISEP